MLYCKAMLISHRPVAMCYQILESIIKMTSKCAILIVIVSLGSVSGQPSGSGDSIYNNACLEILQDGQTLYNACGSEPVVLLNNRNAVHNVTVEPASLTCGDPATPYCTLGILECDECDSSKPDKSHLMPDLTDISAEGAQNLDTWWQSVTWTSYPSPLEINITVSFDHLYELQDDLVITFKSSLPSHMVLEKSTDFGHTWSVLQYYKARCNDTYPGVPLEVTADQPDAVICTSAFSTDYPYANGKAIFSVIQDRFGLFLGANLLNFENLYDAFSRTNLNDFLKFSDLRIRLLTPATDGNEQLKRNEDLIKYYYGIAGISIIGSCDCNLHGKYCSVGPEGRTVCTCSHNTEGDNCERCKPLYNNKLWSPGFYVPYPSGTANPCEKCECNDHADSCTYSPTLQQGLCDNCQHNTTGATCAQCQEGFFPNNTLAVTHPDRCTLCDCEPLGVASGNTACVLPDGQCFCQSFTQGRRCDECKDTFYGLLLQDNSPGTCKPCDCNPYGTVNQNRICAKSDGQCPCKLNTGDRECSVCKEGFYSFPTGRPSGDCLDCECDPGGSSTMSCHQQTGECQCRPSITLQHCNQTLDGFFAPSLDHQQYQPAGGTCLPDTDLVSADNPFTGRVYSVCDTAQDVTFDDIDGRQIQPQVIWPYLPTIRYTLKSPDSWNTATLLVVMTGESGVDVTDYRVRQPDTEILFNCNAEGSLNNMENIPIEGLAPGTGNAWIAPTSISLDVRCRYSLQLLMADKGNVNTTIVIDSVVMIPNHNHSLVYQRALPEQQSEYRACQRRIAALGTRDQALGEYSCRRFSFATTTQLGFGAQACDCDPLGTLAGGPCDRDGGQCRCKAGVAGRRCDVCAPGFYNRTETGCLPCECDQAGSSNLVCDYDTGQCPCLLNVATAGQLSVLRERGDLQCRNCVIDHYGHATGQGCQLCSCDTQGSTNPQCDDLGVCTCKDTLAGDKCDRCQDGSYSFSENGCIPCDCDAAGSVDINCDIVSGTCTCKPNVVGDKCDMCNDESFNLVTSNPDGCQRCFCYGHSTTCTAAPGFSAAYIVEDNASGWPLVDPLGTGVSSHCELPAHYLGNRRSSYGQTFSFMIQTRDGINVDLSGEPAIVLEGNSQVIVYNTSGLIARSPVSTLDARLHETGWMYNTSARPDYFNMYAILTDLTGIYIQRRFGNDIVDFMNISMVTTKLAEAGEAISTYVENCTCEDVRHTAGLSCETCAQGFKRPSESAGSYIPCAACDCSGRAQTDPPVCDEITGECLNCKVGTNGTACSECAQSVQNCDQCSDTQCGVCLDEFWGITELGCQSCDCDGVGADNTICDKESGQCSCRANVADRQCDQCADNYFSLSPTGCQLCNECYGLVNEDVDKLRALRDNLTDFELSLTAGDLTESIGSFASRLTETQTNMEWLLLFLSEASRVQGSTAEELDRLNRSLVDLTGTLQTTVQTSLDQATSDVIAADTSTEQGRDAINATSGALMETNTLLLGDILAWRADIATLVGSIESVQQAMAGVSDSATGNAMRISGVVEAIESGSKQAKDTADQAYLTSQGAQNVHRFTSNQVTQLEQYTSVVTLSKDQTSLAVSYAYGNASASLQQANAALSNATDMQPIGTDVPAMVNRAVFIASQADSLAQQANQTVVDSSATVGLIRNARLRTDGLLDQLRQVSTTSDILQTRQSDAYLLATNQESLANQSFNDAERMLRIMSDFNNEAFAVEVRANQSLKTVQQIQDSGERSIVDGIELQANLQRPFSNSTAALRIAESALHVSADNIQAYDPVQMSASTLYGYSNGVLTDVTLYPDIVASVNTSVVIPADDTCQTYLAQTTALQSKTDVVMNTATSVSDNVTVTTQRAQQITQDFAEIRSITDQSIADLKALVSATRSTFNKPLLASSVTTLTDAMESQRLVLDNMKQRRDQLQLEIRRLRTVQEQLRATRN